VNLVALFAGPDALAAFGAGLLQGPAAPVAEPPLPGGVAAVVRFLFNVPAWIQIAGLVVGVSLAAAVLLVAWRRRVALRTWVTTRPHRMKVGLAVAAAVLVLGGAGFGAVSWNYMQHENGFCTGCHVMKPAYQRFTQSEHDSLSCHDCHQQSIFASARQMYLWIAERPAEIGPHAKVPTPICARCHVTGEPEVWQRIASTAGHRTHLESDSSALRGVQCVTCHGLEVHSFAPVDSTCGQANCHLNNQIELGKMAGQTSLHCVTCHQFTAEVPKLATRDSASGTLRPGSAQCFSCHEMRALLSDFDPARDPHNGTCGMCHNPHTQRRPADAKQTCTTSQCHADWRSEPFHVGTQHRNTGQQCTLCHVPHQAKVDASDCEGCHADVRRRTGGRLQLPVPFDTTRALRRVSWLGPHDEPRGKGDAAPPFDDLPAPGSLLPAPADSFSHDRHKSLACLTCHVTRAGHGRLTFAPPRGCQICHHQAPAASECAKCHDPQEIAPAESVTVRLAVAGAPPRGRPATFAHETHRDLKCVACHSEPVSLSPDSRTASCAACHEDHHTAARDCVACHSQRDSAVLAAHSPPVEGHTDCDACHQPAIVARLVPDRLMCITCHAKRREHYPAGECTTCHFLTSPEEFRTHLTRRGP
jgi:nitrate/TMAO reductase-like tetraheme cytochrome c subunit